MNEATLANLVRLDLFNCNLGIIEKGKKSKLEFPKTSSRKSISPQKENAGDSKSQKTLTSLKSLKSLNLSYNSGFLKSKNLDDDLINALFNPSLKELHLIDSGLSQSKILAKIIQRTGNLNLLDISQNEALPDIQKCLPTFDKWLPFLEVFKMNKFQHTTDPNSLTGHMPMLQLQMSNIVHLNISETLIPVETILQSDFSNLKILMFDKNKLSNDGLKNIFSCEMLKNLKFLSVRENLIKALMTPDLSKTEYSKVMKLDVIDITKNSGLKVFG